MRRLVLVFLLSVFCIWSGVGRSAESSVSTDSGATGSSSSTIVVTPDCVKQVTDKLITKFGEASRVRIERGVPQAAVYWRTGDGTTQEFEQYCLDNFASDPVLLKDVFARFEKNFESIQGNYHRITRDIKEPIDLDIGEKLPVDEPFAKFDPSNHLQEDLFQTKLAFYVLLNFAQTSLMDKLKDGPKWSRDEWAQTRLVDYFPARVPADVQQKINDAQIAGESYINDYNIFAGYLLTADKKTPFAEDLSLISHWGLRDHLATLYVTDDGLAKQEMIFKVMERIIDQSIPQSVINKKTFWDPYSNTVFEKASDTYKQIPASPEPDTRYAMILKTFHAQQIADPLYPKYPRYIDRRFDLERQIPEKEVERILTSLVSSDVLPAVGELISKRIKRPLRPYDLWYSGFKVSGMIPEKELNEKIRQKYATLEAFTKDVPRILQFLGFTPEKAQYLIDRIAIDPARGAGHATGAMMHGDKAHLRTRVPKNSMDYQGFNTAMHELGHCVEQTFTLYDSDHILLAQVPNNACTECFAFVFQFRDMDVLGMPLKDPQVEHIKTLDTFWTTYEIAGVALVDLQVWRWMYENQNATPAQLKEATIKIAKDVWNKYYAPVFKIQDCPILAIYSHMIAYPLYLADYPLGFIICYQIEDFLKGKNLAVEMERMCKSGYLTPKQWMENAVGSDISPEAIIKAAKKAVEALNK
ncbi:MAG: hypothetical protein HQM08_01625 [Candidatus Riflebacteria bacterium]|nr:hypothetical protein [Candidatus Riflebacteria bacterium]